MEYKVRGILKSMMLQTPTWAVGGAAPTKPLQRPSKNVTSERKTKPTVISNSKEELKAAFEEDDGIDYGSVLDSVGIVEVPDEIRVLSSDANLGNKDFILLTSAALLAQIPKDERVLRTTFVREYLYDFDPLLAAIRTGFLNVRSPTQRYSPAMNAARMLMAEPVVQRLIKECMLEAVSQDDSEKLVYTMLLREATNHGVSGNASARNGAFKMLLEAFEKAKENRYKGQTVLGNVMLMPAENESFDGWEKQARQLQKALKDSVRA